MSTATTGTTRWGQELADGGMGGLVEAVEDPLGHLAEVAPTGQPGAYWPQPDADDAKTDAARERAVRAALAELERVLGRATRGVDLRQQSLLLGAVDRALADPENGYLRRLRTQRSAVLRQRVAQGATVAQLARELGVTETRVRTLLNNNKAYVSASRQLALQQLAADGKVARERAARERTERVARAAADRAADRAVAGRIAAARIAAGESRAQVAEAMGVSRQKLAVLLAAARDATN